MLIEVDKLVFSFCSVLKASLKFMILNFITDKRNKERVQRLNNKDTEDAIWSTYCRQSCRQTEISG